MLYEKNGVITEDRFKKLTVVQWIFHYLEVMKNKKEDNKIGLEIMDAVIKANIRTITEDLELLGLVVDKDRGVQVMEIKQKAREQSEKDKKAKELGIDTVTEEGPEFTSEDAELMAFFNSQPETREASSEQSNIGKFFLPAVDIKKKMSLGFEDSFSEETLAPRTTSKDMAKNLGFGEGE